AGAGAAVHGTDSRGTARAYEASSSISGCATVMPPRLRSEVAPGRLSTGLRTLVDPGGHLEGHQGRARPDGSVDDLGEIGARRDGLHIHEGGSSTESGVVPIR